MFLLNLLGSRINLTRSYLNSKYENLNSLTNIDLSNKNIQSIDKDTFRDLNSLKEINLSHNQIESIHYDTFKGLTSLTTIYLNNNNIRSIDRKTFKGLSHLTKVSLLKNQLEDEISLVLEPNLNACIFDISINFIPNQVNIN